MNFQDRRIAFNKIFSKIILELLEETTDALSIAQIKTKINKHSDYIRFFEEEEEIHGTETADSFLKYEIGLIIFDLKNKNKILIFNLPNWKGSNPILTWIVKNTKFIGTGQNKQDHLLEQVKKNPQDFQSWFVLFKFYHFRTMNKQSIFCLECIEKEFENEDYLKKLDEKNLKHIAYAYLNRVYEITNEREFYFKETGKLLENDITLIYKASKIFSRIYQDRKNNEKNPDPRDAYSNVNGKIIRNSIIKALSLNFTIDIYRNNEQEILENL